MTDNEYNKLVNDVESSVRKLDKLKAKQEKNRLKTTKQLDNLARLTLTKGLFITDDNQRLAFMSLLAEIENKIKNAN